jgi:hypothetical protein
MKTKTALLSLSLFLISVVSQAQVKEKSSDPAFKRNVIGIQYNPVYNGHNSYNLNLYSVRYGYKVSRPITVGAEITATFPNGNYPELTYNPHNLNLKNYYSLSTNLFFRYSFRSDKRLQLFLEASPYAQLYLEKPFHHLGDDIFVYVAPGVSLFSKNRKFSMDLYYKFSTGYFNNGTQRCLAYKLNFHF